MFSRSAIVTEATSWVGTPFQHQGRTKGPHGGVDCVGLIIGVSKNLGYYPQDVPHNYQKQPNTPMLNKTCETLLTKPANRQGLAKALPGDILMFATNQAGQGTHLAWAVMLNGRLSMLHVMTTQGATVCMHRIAPPWTSKYLTTYTLPFTEEPA
jgi:cell wall-associated NlpC family hydrolase